MPISLLRQSLSILFFLSLLSISGASLAAIEGRLGTNSESEIQISLAILPSIQIETGQNINLRISDRSVDAGYEKSFCVRGNEKSGSKYAVTATGSEKDGNFVLFNAQGEALAYTVSFRGNPETQTVDSLSPGVQSIEYKAMDRSTPCVDQTAFLINFPANMLQAVDSGLYSGSLTLLISPV